MKISPKTRSRCLLLIVLIAAVTLGSAFAVVWTQQQISRSAQSAKQTEADPAEMIRRINFIDQRIATLHQPVVLQGKVAGRLRPSMENQIVWVREQELPARRAYAVANPYEVSIDLAMLDANSPR